MRYSIIGATVEQVRSVGGLDIKEARSSRIIFATLAKEQADRLKSMGCRVDQVGKVEATVMPPPIVAPPAPVAAAPTYTPEQLSFAAGLEELRGLFDPPLYGEGFNLALVDTGIRETHEKIRGSVIYSKNYTSAPMRDGFDHGSGVASIALAIVPSCNLLNLKVLDDKGAGTEEEVVLAIDDCIEFHDTQPDIAPSVINLSLGAPDDGNPNNILRVACRAAIERGIWVSAAAGNSGPADGTIFSPACEKYVFATGSAKYEPFQVSDFSSRGPTKEGLVKPDALMFGENIIMASSASDTATVAKSGTSFSTPFSSGIAILYHESEYKWASYKAELLPGVLPRGTIGRLLTIQELMDQYLAGICVKPQGAPAVKDNVYGCGLPFGPLVAQAIGVRPAIDISAMLTPVLAIAMLGMVMIPMAEAFR